MDEKALYAAWKAEEDAAHIHGWDFSHIRGRYEEENDLPWDYEAIVRSHRSPRSVLPLRRRAFRCSAERRPSAPSSLPTWARSYGLPASSNGSFPASAWTAALIACLPCSAGSSGMGKSGKPSTGFCSSHRGNRHDADCITDGVIEVPRFTIEAEALQKDIYSK